MSLGDSLRSWLCYRNPGKKPARPSSRNLVVEHLEDRLAPATLTLVPQADAYIQQAAATSTSGTSAHLYGGGSPVVSSLVRFSVTGLTETVQSAKIRFYFLDGSVDGPAAYATGTSWDENTVNWNTRPARTSGVIDDKAAVAINTWVEYNVSSVVKGNGAFSFELAMVSSDGVKMYSRQGTSPPQLVVTTATTASSTLTANAGPDVSTKEGTAVTFAGTASGGVAPLSYLWNFGDGSTAQGSLTPAHAFADNGTYTVTLSVTDANGVTCQDTALVTVANVAPTVDAGADATVGQGGTFSGAGSFIDPGADTWTATVAYGDGTAAQTLVLSPSKTFSLSHAYSASGTYTVTVTVRDDDGAVGSDIRVVTVNSLLPTVTIQAQDATAAEPGTDTGSFAVSRTGSTSSPLTVSYTVGGTATPGTDFQSLSGTVTIPAGASSAAINVVPLDDSLVEGNETAVITVAASAGYAVGTSTSATITIADNDVSAGRTLYVSTTGSDSSNGSLATPWRTITFATSKLLPGDTLYVRGGTYSGRATVSISGTPAAPITIRAYPGETPVFDSGIADFRTVGNSDWVVDNAALGIYKSVKTYSALGTLYGYVTGIPGYIDGIVGLVPYQSEAMFRASTDQYVDSTTPFYAGPGTFLGSDGHVYIRLAKTAELRYDETRDGTVFTSDLPDPRNYAIVISGVSSTLTVTGSYLTIDGLEVHQATRSIYVQSTAHDLVFNNVTAWNGDRAIEIAGAYNIRITQSRFYGDVPRWIAWSDSKSSPAPADKMRTTNVNMTSGAHDIEISYSHIRGGHDLVGMNNNEYNITVHHCRIENGQDDAFEIEGTINVGRHDFYENYIGNCLTAFSEGQDSPQFDGPGFIYRNVIVLLHNPFINRASGINTWNGGGRYGFEYMFKQSGSSGYVTKNVNIYQNTLVMLNTAGDGLRLNQQNATNARVANNLCVMVNGVVDASSSTAPGYVRDGNLYWKVNTVDSTHLLAGYDTVSAFASATGMEAHGIGATSKRGTDPQFATFRLNVLDRTKSVWELAPNAEVFKPSDFLLSASSPAIGTGIVIPDLPNFGPLPDSRNSRDIGAIPFGASAAAYNVFPFTVTGPSALLAAAAPHPVSAQALSPGQLRPIIQEAIARWQATGLSPDQLQLLEQANFRVTDLGGAFLGKTDGNTIWLDDNAAGWGWFIDATPGNDSEFFNPGNQGEQHRMDLLTTVMHEMGHILGLDHGSATVMGETLAAGTRELPGLEAVLSDEWCTKNRTSKRV